MLKTILICTIALLFLNLSTFAFSAEKGKIVHEEITSSSLSGNLIGNPITKPLAVYLPPGYDESPDQSYPVIYVLHGASRLSANGKEDFERSYESFVIDHGAPFVDNLVAEDKTKGVILVGLDGTTKDGCSYYVNSVANGNYANYICKELVPYMDTHYQTMTGREGRGIIGYSAGAFGAMYLGMIRSNYLAELYI